MIQRYSRAAAALLVLCLVVQAGCKRQEDIAAYNAPKDAPPEAPMQASAPVTWTVPTGWHEAALQSMEFAAFLVASDHAELRVTVIPLPYSPEQLGSNLNRWEAQVALPPTPAGEVERLAKPLADARVPMSVVDLVGKDPKTGAPKRIVASIAQQAGVGWFFKLAGPPEVIEQQKSAFEAFLKSVQFTDQPDGHKHVDEAFTPDSAPSESGGSPHSAPAGPTHLEWGALPSGWVVDQTPNQFRNYSFKISGAGGQGELAVTKMSKEGAGPPLNNINMWRKDVGLPPVANADGIESLDYKFKDRPGIGFDIAGPERRIILVTTGSGDELWFFKLRGPVALVESQKASLESFLKSVSFVGDVH